MKIEQNRLEYLLQEYADNSCSKEEMDELFRLIASSKNNTQFNDQLLTIWNSIHPDEKVSSIDENELFREIENRISVPSGKQWWMGWSKAAAVVLAVASAGIIYFISARDQAGTPTTADNINSIVTKPDHKLIKLPDGSNVLLNNNSTLDYPPQFTGDHREVILVGEAYFDIVRDPARPFIIRTGNLKTKVLGTAFNIRAYPDETDVTVTVTRGKVKVETDDKLLGILIRNQQISFNTKSSAAIQHEVLADSVITWKEKDLVFDNITFEEAAREISKRYGVQVLFASDNMKKCRFHASFLNENQVDQVLTVLCDLNKATYQIKNNVVMIMGEGCN